MIRQALGIAVLWLLAFIPVCADAYELLILQSHRSPVYDEVLKGLRSVRSVTHRLIVLADYAEVDLQRILREERPLVIVTLGDNALTAARKARQVPVVALMAAGLRTAGSGPAMVTGVEVLPAPERYLAVLQLLKARRVGLIADPVRSGPYLQRVRQAAARVGIELVTREVTASREVADRLSGLKGRVDALWMLPDATAVARETVEGYFLFSLDQQIPVITFSGAYLPSGAAVAIEVDRYDTGRQGGELAAALLDGGSPAEYPPVAARSTALRLNQTVLKRLGLSLDPLGRGRE